MPLHHKLYQGAFAGGGGPGAPPDALGALWENGGINNLSTSLTLDATPVTAQAYYLGSSAALGTWTATQGNNLTGQGSGGLVNQDAPTPGSADRAVRFDATRYWQDAATGAPAIGTDDFAVAIVGQITAGTEYLFSTGAQGIKAYHAGAAQLRFEIDDGTTSALVTTNSLGREGDWFHAVAFFDRSGSAQIYANSVANGAPVNISAVTGSLTGDSGLTLGADEIGFNNHSRGLALLAIWHQPAWMTTHLQAAAAAEHYERTVGLWQGNYPRNITQNRSSAAYIDYNSYVDDERRLMPVSIAWHRVHRRIDNSAVAKVAYMAESSENQLCLHTEDLSNAAWVLGIGTDTKNSNTSAAPTGEVVADQLSCDATVGLHSVTQTVTTIATITSWGAWFKPGTATWVYLAVPTIANVTGYFNLSGAGSKGSIGSAITSSEIAAYDNGWYRVHFRFSSTAAANDFQWAPAAGNNNNTTSSLDIEVFGAQIDYHAHATTYIPRASGATDRQKDRWFLDTTGIDLTEGTLIVDVLNGDHATATSGRFHTLSDGSNANYFLQRFLATAGLSQALIVNSSSTQAAITSTSGLSDGDWHEFRLTWRANEVKVFVDGVQEGATDTSATIPTGITDWDIGGDISGNIQPYAMIRLRLFQSVQEP